MGGSGEVVATVIGGSGLVRSATSGADKLAAMSAEEFAARLESVETAQKRVRQIQARLMKDGEDYGEIPGTQKPTLLKPGAEKLAAFYGLVATFEVQLTHGDGVTTPPARAFVRCLMHLGSADGPVVGEGYGTASAWESKHRWRTAKRSCPSCGSVGAISKSKYADRETGDIGWYCRDCKANYASTDEAITAQELGRIENPDPSDVENTVVKIGKKRAFVDGVLTTTATSGLFTQDVEDSADGGVVEGEAPKAPAASTSRAPAPARSSAPAPVAPATGAKPACAKCHTNAKVIVGKYPDKRTRVAKPWYCLTCRTTWGDSEAPTDPGSEPWGGEPMDEPGAEG